MLATIKAITVTKQCAIVAPHVAVVDDWPTPEVGPGEVLIETEASAMNHLDLWVGIGLPGIELTYPRVGGSDGAGRIIQVGQGVDESWLDTRIVINAAKLKPSALLPNVIPAPPEISMIGEHINGTHASAFVAPVTNVFPIGDADAVAAAAYSLSFLTAWRMLSTKANLRPGQSVLITGIGGGVALSAFCLAKHFGCHTIVTSRYQHKLDHALALGADDAILDSGEDFSRPVRAATNKRGVDVCIDSVGKAIHLGCIKSLARGGKYVTCGCTTGPDAKTDLARIFWNQQSILGSTMGSMEEFREVMNLFLRDQIQPVIDSVHPPSEATEAYERLETGHQFGKIVFDWK